MLKLERWISNATWYYLVRSQLLRSRTGGECRPFISDDMYILNLLSHRCLLFITSCQALNKSDIFWNACVSLPVRFLPLLVYLLGFKIHAAPQRTSAMIQHTCAKLISDRYGISFGAASPRFLVQTFPPEMKLGGKSSSFVVYNSCSGS